MKTLGEKLGVTPKVIAIFGTYALKNNTLRSGLQHWNLTGAEATVELGPQRKGVTATRVVALGVFALAAKKDKTELFIRVTLANGQPVIIEGPAAKQKQAYEFAAKINQVSNMTFN